MAGPAAKPFAVAVSLFLPLWCLPAEPQPWGEVVNGLRMSVRLGAERWPRTQLVVTIANTGDKPVLLPVGSFIGYEAATSRLRLIVRTPDGSDHPAYFTGRTVVAGRVDPLVIPMAPLATYTIRLPISDYYVPRAREKLDMFVLKWCWLRVRLDARSASCPLYGHPNPNMVDCWTGRLESNSLELPQL